MDGKKRLSAKEIVADIWKGLDDDALMTKFGLSRKQLDAVFKKLVAVGHISQADLGARGKGPEELLEVEPDISSLPTPKSRDAESRAVSSYDQSIPAEPTLTSGSYTTKAAIGIIGGFVIPIVGALIIQPGGPLAILIFFAALALLLWGCYNLAKHKGYHGALCLLGLLGCFGPLILLIIPNKNKQGASWSPAIVAVAVAGIGVILVAVMGIVAAIAIPYYVSYKRTSCDRMAAGDVAKLAAAMERLGNELGDSSLTWNEESVGELASKNGVAYFVGPYYGWGGCTKKCGVLARMSKENDRWFIECVSLKGSHPQGSGSRYVYRVEVIGGKDLPAKVIRNPIDARDGVAQNWNSYPINDKCFTGSLIQKAGGSDNALFTIKTPRSASCSALRAPQ